VVIELDEMWHFLQRKTNTVWIWKAKRRFSQFTSHASCNQEDASGLEQ
jgi:IS1 family transposase